MLRLSRTMPKIIGLSMGIRIITGLARAIIEGLGGGHRLRLSLRVELMFSGTRDCPCELS